MSLFQTILSRLSARIDKEAHGREDVALLIQQATGVSLSPEAVVIKKGVVYITAGPTIKMAILIKKEKILSLLKEKGFSITAIG